MKTVLQRLLLTGFFAACTSLALAQTSMVPSAMSYQGLLTDDQGNPVAPTTPENRNVEFRIYNIAAGGTPLWGEAQTVTVFKGNFSVILGNGTAVGAPSGPTAFANVFTNATSADLYFGITPQGGVEFAPRQKLLSSAFALRAKTAETVNATAQPGGQPSQFNWLAANDLAINGHSKVIGTNVMEFGFGVAGKDGNAGKIGYQAFSSGLDIVGAGVVDTQDRRITMWAESGTDFKGPIGFGERTGQHINLYNTFFGIGVQSETLYNRTASTFAWYQGGEHSGAFANSGGGTTLALLNGNGFDLKSGKFIGDGSGLTNVPIPSAVNNLAVNGSISKIGHGPFIGGSDYGHSIGSQDWTTYERSSRNFAWYLGGTFNTGELNAGGGTRVMTLTGGGLNVNQGALTMETGPINFGSRLGQHINLYGNSFGLGVQNAATYFRTGSGGSFNWFVAGAHSDTTNDAGGGVQIANWNGDRFDFYRRVSLSDRLDVGTTVRSNSYLFNNTDWSIASGADLDIYKGNTRRAWLFGGAGGNWNVPSDRNLKKDIHPMEDGLSNLKKLKPSTYHFKEEQGDGPPSLGFIAQEVRDIFPQLVSQKDGILGMNYDGLIPVTVAAVQEQQQQIETLGKENGQLKTRLAELEAKFEKLSGQLPPTAATPAGKIGGE